jgi:cytochrome b561
MALRAGRVRRLPESGGNGDAGSTPQDLHGRTRKTGRFLLLRELGELPAIIGPDKALAKQAITAHEFVAYLLLVVIALHAAAALFHHFVRRDDVLNGMLLVQRR